MDHDKIYLKRALELANQGRFTTAPNPNVGCVIVREKRIIGEGYHQYAGDAHAEIKALNQAGNEARGATVYVTLEPCSHYGRTPPCVDALIDAGVSKVVAAMPDPNPKVSGCGFYKLQKAGITVRYGLMLTEAESINKGFFKRMRTGLPWVRLKIAVSIDGRTAMASGESKWITSNESRRDVQRWRAESDAILSTSATVLKDNPALTVRWSALPEDIKDLYPEKQLRQPVRIIIDSANRVMPYHKVVKDNGTTWLIRLTTDDLTWPSSVEQILLSAEEKTNSIAQIDLLEMMIQLGHRKINSILVEVGAKLSGALLSAKLVDELIIYQAPKLLGTTARPLCFLPNVVRLGDALEFTLLDVKKIGPDLRLCFKPN